MPMMAYRSITNMKILLLGWFNNNIVKYIDII